MSRELWEKCKNFHGHECGGLTIGYKASLYVIKLLNLEKQEHDSCFSSDEEIVCIAENDACGIDAIQVILGCSIGKGNLLFHMTGKQAFSFYNRTSGKSFRLVLKARPEGMTKEQSFHYYQNLEPEEMFDVKAAKIPLPSKAGLSRSLTCSCCKETVSENMVRYQNGNPYCLDCFENYDRFQI